MQDETKLDSSCRGVQYTDRVREVDRLTDRQKQWQRGPKEEKEDLEKNRVIIIR